MKQFIAVVLVLALVTVSQAFFLNSGTQGQGATPGAARQNPANDFLSLYAFTSGNDMMRNMYAMQHMGPMAWFLFN